MIRGEFAGALARLPARRRFDLILLDPPYDEADLDGGAAGGGGPAGPGRHRWCWNTRGGDVPPGAAGSGLVRQS